MSRVSNVSDCLVAMDNSTLLMDEFLAYWTGRKHEIANISLINMANFAKLSSYLPDDKESYKEIEP